MTPKEKAKELLDKYLCIEETYNVDLFCDECGMNEAAKYCALIAVEFAKEFITGDLSEQFDKILYLIDIKEEIEKL